MNGSLAKVRPSNKLFNNSSVSIDSRSSETQLEKSFIELEHFLSSNRYTMYGAIKKISSVEFQLKLMLECFENKKDEVYSEVVNIREELCKISKLKSDRVITSIVTEMIEVIDDWCIGVE